MKSLILLITLSAASANAFYIDLTSMYNGQSVKGKMANYLHKFLPPDNISSTGNTIADQLKGKHFKGLKIKIGNEVLYFSCSNATYSGGMDRAGNIHHNYNKAKAKCILKKFDAKFYDKQYSLNQLTSLANMYNGFTVKLPFSYVQKKVFKPKCKHVDGCFPKFPNCKITAAGCNP